MSRSEDSDDDNNEEDVADEVTDVDCHLEYVTEKMPVFMTMLVNPGPEKLPIAAKVTMVSKASRRRDNIRRAVNILRDGGWWRNVFDDDNAIVNLLGTVSIAKFKYRVIFKFKESFLKELPGGNLVEYAALGVNGTLVVA